MTNNKKLENLKKLADAMYYAAANLGANVGSGERLRKTMEEYHKFIIHEYHKEKPVSKDFETALEKKVREAQDWTYIEEEGGECPLYEEFGADDLEEFARWGADWVRNNEKEPVSEDLEEEVEKMWAQESKCRDTDYTIAELTKQDYKDCARHFANWQKQKDVEVLLNHAKCIDESYKKGIKIGKAEMKQQLMAKAVDIEVKEDAGGYPYIPQMELYDYDKDIPLAKEGDEYKVILIKED